LIALIIHARPSQEPKPRERNGRHFSTTGAKAPPVAFTPSSRRHERPAPALEAPEQVSAPASHAKA